MTDTTTVSLPGALRVAGVAFALVMTTSSTLPLISGAENLSVFKESVISNPTASCSQNLLGAAKTWQEMRAAQISSLRGKYRHILTPSDEFARQKQEEIVLERNVP
jgi:hypothetical protein